MARNLLYLVVGIILGGLITCGFMHRPSPRNWEYKTIWMHSDGTVGGNLPSTVADLNKDAADGWQVAAMTEDTGGLAFIVLKRQK